MTMGLMEKGGGTYQGIKLLLCENPLPPLDEAIVAAEAELARSNYYTEAYSEPLRHLLSEKVGVPRKLIHINAGSELILRQLFDRLGHQSHLLTPTYPLFPEIAGRYTETRLTPENGFAFDLSDFIVPDGTTLVAIVNPNNPNGGTFEMTALPQLLKRYPDIYFLVDEAFIGLGGQSVAHLVPKYTNLLVTRTLSKAHSLAGFRVGYAILPEPLADDLNEHNDAYPLARASQAAARKRRRSRFRLATHLSGPAHMHSHLATRLLWSYPPTLRRLGTLADSATCNGSRRT
jgi:histidinol-phosphate aminotransferase